MSRFVAVTPRGVEPVLEDELRAEGASSIVAERGAVRFEGDLAMAYRVLMQSRTASKLLMTLGSLEEASFEALDAAMHAIRWNEHLRPDGTLAVDVVASGGLDVHTHYAALRTKDAICDFFRERRGIRPSVDTRDPDLRVHVHLDAAGGSIAIDLSGGAMHRRGYRVRGAAAPLKENLAAGILGLAKLREHAREGHPFVDPMCGSGTLLAEAALMAADVAPGLLRARHPVERWLGHDARAFASARSAAEARAKEGRAALRMRLHGFDASAAALDESRRTLAELGFTKNVTLEQRSIERVAADEGVEAGLLVVNPPYGERLGTETELVLVYEALGDSLRRSFPGFDAWVITASPMLAKRIGLRAEERIPLYNGALECRLLHFPIAKERPTGTPAFRKVHEEARAFENRLRKDQKTIGKRAEREGLEVHRLYDADIPEYNLAVDRYADHVVVQEYAPPRSVDPQIAARRLRDALTVIADTLAVPRDKIHLAVRRRQTSGSQYERREAEGTRLVVREGKCRFEVRFDERLDTGLFADHRLLRARMAEEARGKTMLNLFAYTCTASVVAAAEGARATTSVDLSSTYLEWGARNFELNQLSLRNNALVRSDVLRFLEEHRQTYDVVFLNPPSYSRSHRMEGDFSVQRDHDVLLEKAMRLVTRTGSLYFSTHARGFGLDARVPERFEVETLSPKSVPFDFERSPHHAFRLRHR